MGNRNYSLAKADASGGDDNGGVIKLAPHRKRRRRFDPAYAADLARKIDARTIREMNRLHAVADIAGGVSILTEKQDEDGHPFVEFKSKDDLGLLYMNRPRFYPVWDRSGSVKEWKGGDRVVWWLKHQRRRTVRRIVNAPGRGREDGVYNVWKGWGIAPVHDGGKGCPLILDHLLHVWCAGNESLFRWVMSWFAQMVQDPMHKPGTALVLQSEEGAGKGIILNGIFQKILGNAYLQVASKRYLIGNFNSVLQGKLLGFADEAVFAGDKETTNALKSFITEPKLLIEWKRKEPYQIANTIRLIMASNEPWVIDAGRSARRFTCLPVSNHVVGNREYFDALSNEAENGGAASFFGYLLDYDYSGVDLKKAPETEALVEQKILTLQAHDSVAAWWHEVLDTGLVDSMASGWLNQVAKTRVRTSYYEWAKRQNIRYKPTSQQIGQKLAELCPVFRLPEYNVRPAGGDRERSYVVPELRVCREMFTHWLKASTLRWDDGEVTGAVLPPVVVAADEDARGAAKLPPQPTPPQEQEWGQELDEEIPY